MRVLVLLVSLALVNIALCADYTSCIVNYNGQIDLTPLMYDSSDSSPSSHQLNTASTNNFYINFCSQISTKVAESTCVGAAACQVDGGGNWNSAGDDTQTPVTSGYTTSTFGLTPVVAIQYLNGKACASSDRQTTINVGCGTTEGIVSEEEVGTCNYIVYYSTSSITPCNPDAPVAGGSPGSPATPVTPAGESENSKADVSWSIMMSLCVLFFIYVVVGMLIKYFKFEGRGLDMIPNYDLWKELPFLFKDGIIFTIQKCSGGRLCMGYSEI